MPPKPPKKTVTKNPLIVLSSSEEDTPKAGPSKDADKETDKDVAKKKQEAEKEARAAKNRKQDYYRRSERAAAIPLDGFEEDEDLKMLPFQTQVRYFVGPVLLF